MTRPAVILIYEYERQGVLADWNSLVNSDILLAD